MWKQKFDRKLNCRNRLIISVMVWQIQCDPNCSVRDFHFWYNGKCCFQTEFSPNITSSTFNVQLFLYSKYQLFSLCKIELNAKNILDPKTKQTANYKRFKRWFHGTSCGYNKTGSLS